MTQDRSTPLESNDDNINRLPPKLAVDGKGFVWRVYSEHWSMAPSNPDNSPIPEPVTFYKPIRSTPLESVVEERSHIDMLAELFDPTDDPHWQRRSQLLIERPSLVLDVRREHHAGRMAIALDASFAALTRLADRVETDQTREAQLEQALLDIDEAAFKSGLDRLHRIRQIARQALSTQPHQEARRLRT